MNNQVLFSPPPLPMDVHVAQIQTSCKHFTIRLVNCLVAIAGFGVKSNLLLIPLHLFFEHPPLCTLYHVHTHNGTIMYLLWWYHKILYSYRILVQNNTKFQSQIMIHGFMSKYTFTPYTLHLANHFPVTTCRCPRLSTVNVCFGSCATHSRHS